MAPGRVETGALDDHRHYGRQLAGAALGWVLVAIVVVSLFREADRLALDLTLFLAGVSLIVGVTAVALAVGVVHSASGSVPELPAVEPVDALGRTVARPRDPGALRGEITIESADGARRYVGRGA